jgi:hypothetical protein
VIVELRTRRREMVRFIISSWDLETFVGESIGHRQYGRYES